MIRQETYKDGALSIPNGLFCWYNEKGKLDSCGRVINSKKNGRWEYYLGDHGQFVKRSTYKSDKVSDSSAEETDVTQKEAVFQKGAKDWLKYLSRNLETPNRFSSIFPNGRYTVNVCFLISKAGKVQEVYLRRSVEWSADAEVFRIIESSP